jgi:hypothetical protein
MSKKRFSIVSKIASKVFTLPTIEKLDLSAK